MVTKRHKIGYLSKKFLSKRSHLGIVKYRSGGPYGAEVKTSDIAFQNTATSSYDPDASFPDCTVLPINNDGMDHAPAPVSNGAIQALNIIKQGYKVSQRIGNRVSLKSLRIRLQLYAYDNHLGVTTSARLVLIYDRQTNGAYPSNLTTASFLWPQIFSAQSTESNNNTDILPTQLMNIDVNSLERYVVLMDKTLELPPVGLIESDMLMTGPSWNGEDTPFIIDEYIKLRNLTTVYNQLSDTTIEQIVTGGLYLISIGNIVNATAPYAWQGTCRLRFHDN
jgi:hypothetical protein